MPRYHTLGKIPHKRHTTFKKPDGSLYQEELFGTAGFAGMSSLIYHLQPPTVVSEIKRGADVSPKIAIDKNMKALSFKGFSQYTETINSNRPGASQGAFAVGKNVLQFEIGGKISDLSHVNFKNSTMNETQLNYIIRYGFLKNKLEVIINGAYNQNKSINKFISEDVIEEKFLNKQTLGFKYLVFDPFKNKKWHSVSLLSWKKNRRIRLVDFIPALSVYAGVNYIPKNGYSYDDPFTSIKKSAEYNIFNHSFFNKANWKMTENVISPKASIITQNHFIGKWVLVNNITLDRIGDKNPILNHITTLTHNYNNPKWSSFIEYEMIKNDIYADNYYKFGVAFLLNRNYQFDSSIGTNIKDTPRNLYFNFGPNA